MASSWISKAFPFLIFPFLGVRGVFASLSAYIRSAYRCCLLVRCQSGWASIPTCSHSARLVSKWAVGIGCQEQVFLNQLYMETPEDGDREAYCTTSHPCRLGEGVLVRCFDGPWEGVRVDTDGESRCR